MRSGTGGARGWSWIWDAVGCGEEGSRCGPCSVECCTCSSLPSQGGIDVLGSVGGSKAIIITTKIVIIVVSAERIDQEGPEPDGPHPLLHQRQGWAQAAPRLQSCPLLPWPSWFPVPTREESRAKEGTAPSFWKLLTLSALGSVWPRSSSCCWGEIPDWSDRWEGQNPGFGSSALPGSVVPAGEALRAGPAPRGQG